MYLYLCGVDLGAGFGLGLIPAARIALRDAQALAVGVKTPRVVRTPGFSGGGGRRLGEADARQSAKKPWAMGGERRLKRMLHKNQGISTVRVVSSRYCWIQMLHFYRYVRVVAESIVSQERAVVLHPSLGEGRRSVRAAIVEARPSLLLVPPHHQIFAQELFHRRRDETLNVVRGAAYTMEPIVLEELVRPPPRGKEKKRGNQHKILHYFKQRDTEVEHTTHENRAQPPETQL